MINAITRHKPYGSRKIANMFRFYQQRSAAIILSLADFCHKTFSIAWPRRAGDAFRNDASNTTCTLGVHIIDALHHNSTDTHT